MRKKKVLISGAGIAGIICAILLDKEKFDISIIEKGASFRNIGFSIVLWKNGFSLLNTLLKSKGINLIEEKNYFKVSAFKLFGGLKLKEITTLDSNYFAYVFEREYLMQILEKVLTNEATRDIRFSSTIENIQYNCLTKQTSILVTKNNSRELFDLVIVAEGINSTSRKLIFPKENPLDFPYYLKYEWLASKSNLVSNGALIYTKGHIGVIHPPFFKNLLGFYFKKGTTETVQLNFENQIKDLVKQENALPVNINKQTANIFRLNKIILKKYFFKNIVLIGDAAHGQPPTLGFGTTLAIEDSILLSNFLNNTGQPDNEDITVVLNQFFKNRVKRIRRVYKFQNFIHLFITNSSIKIKILTLLLKLFYGKIIEIRVKRLASYNLEKLLK